MLKIKILVMTLMACSSLASAEGFVHDTKIQSQIGFAKADRIYWADVHEAMGIVKNHPTSGLIVTLSQEVAMGGMFALSAVAFVEVRAAERLAANFGNRIGSNGGVLGSTEKMGGKLFKIAESPINGSLRWSRRIGAAYFLGTVPAAGAFVMYKVKPAEFETWYLKSAAQVERLDAEIAALETQAN